MDGDLRPAVLMGARELHFFETELPNRWNVMTFAEQAPWIVRYYDTARPAHENCSVEVLVLEARIIVLRAERDKVIAEVREQARVLESKLTATPFPPPGISRSDAAALAAHLRIIADGGGTS